MSPSLIMPRENFTGQQTVLTDLIDINDIVKKVLESCKDKLQEAGAIVRQDGIPPVRGNAAEMTFLFSSLVEIILKHPPREGKLFIYARCSEKDPASDDKIVTISIHTNTYYDVSWEQTHAGLLGDCGKICKANGGDFIYHLVSNTSCLFTINLQGK